MVWLHNTEILFGKNAHLDEDFSCSMVIHIPSQDFYKYDLDRSKWAINES